MRETKSGELLFAMRLFATERTSRRREAPTWWPHAFNLAVVTSFLFFFLM